MQVEDPDLSVIINWLEKGEDSVNKLFYLQPSCEILLE